LSVGGDDALLRSAATRGSADPALPLGALQVHLRLITETLARELASPGATAPGWSATQWVIAPAVAAIHGVAALLPDRLRWQGPPHWARFLGEQKAHTARRVLHIERLLQLLDESARAAGVALIALKGAALHAGGYYRAGERPMADIDLLVRETDAARAVRLLGGLGFRERSRTWKHVVFERAGDARPAALGEHYRNPIIIELHSRAVERLALRPVDVSELVLRGPLHAGLNPYPSRSALLMHVLLHAAGSMAFRQLRLLQLEDIARLASAMTSEEWTSWLGFERSLWWAFPPLTLTARYYGCIPEPVLAQASAQCHWWLRRAYVHRDLTACSLSYLWVSAFPAGAWARSPRELLAYASARVMPGAVTRRQRVEFARLQPRVSGGSWAQLSQRQRMLHWLLAWQPRHETLQPVRAALQECSDYGDGVAPVVRLV
jgi:hypothetical protein